MNENCFHRVGVQRRRPVLGKHVEEYFHGLAGLESNLILRIVESLKDVRIEVDEVFLVAHTCDVLKELAHADGCRESQVIAPVVVHAPFNFSAALFEVCVQFFWLDKVLLKQSHEADKSSLSDFSTRAATLPGESREEDHLEDNLTVKFKGRVKDLLVQQMLK